MFVEQKFCVGLSDVNIKKELTNTALLRYLEDVAGIHSEMAGYGFTDMDKTKKTWVLLCWNVEVKKRPLINDTLTVKTWSRNADRIYALRDFEVKDQYNNVVCVAATKWLFIDIDKEKFIKIPDDVIRKYEPEPEAKVFENETFEKLTEPETCLNKISFKITRSMIDINRHLHNIYYLDIAKEALPEEIGLYQELNRFEVMYKKEIKLGEEVKAIYTEEKDYHYITIKNENESLIHSIIRFKKQ